MLRAQQADPKFRLQSACRLNQVTIKYDGTESKALNVKHLSCRAIPSGAEATAFHQVPIKKRADAPTTGCTASVSAPPFRHRAGWRR